MCILRPTSPCVFYDPPVIHQEFSSYCPRHTAQDGGVSGHIGWGQHRGRPYSTKAARNTNRHRSRVPACTHNLMTAVWHQRWSSTRVNQKLDRFRCVLWPYTHLTDTTHLERQKYPTSTTRHMDRPWNDQPFGFSRRWPAETKKAS